MLEALTKVSHFKVENNRLADKLTAEAQKCDLLDYDVNTLKVENTELQGRLKVVLSDMHGIGHADGASTSKAKGINCLAQNSVVTNHVVHVTKQLPKRRMCDILNEFPLVITVELNDTFNPIAISCEVHQNKSNGK